MTAASVSGDARRRLAVVLFNLGGPDSQDAVRPFLFNLFNDKAIVGVPQPVRHLLARLISSRRTATAQEIYKKLGGRSPILPNTERQAAALGTALDAQLAGYRTKIFVAMRYWRPFVADAVEDVRRFAPDEIVLLPLYPQFSTTTTGSSFAAWHEAARAAGLTAPTRAVCCYPADRGFVDASAALIGEGLAKLAPGQKYRVLFSAHGLPKKIVDRGDPYRLQVEQSVAAVAGRLGLAQDARSICYQSRVGPLEWIGPSTEAEIRRAAADGLAIILVPIAFVSEHSETLYELDMLYADEAAKAGAPQYLRIPTVSVHAIFIDGLAGIVRASLGRAAGLHPAGAARLCPRGAGRCPAA